MSKIDELIRQHCPDGVEYARSFASGDVEYIRGITYNKSQETSDEDNCWKVLRANNIMLGSNTLNFDDVKLISNVVKVKKQQYLKQGDILICAGSGSKDHIGKVAYIFEDMELTFGGFMAVIRCSRHINSRYLFHVLTSRIFKLYLGQSLNSATINNLNKGVMDGLEIPVPPIEVQEEVVRVLDAMCELEAKLQEELEAREKQFCWYCESLLNQAGVQYENKSLQELNIEIRSGWGFPKSKQGKTVGDYPFYKVSDMNLPGNEVSMHEANNHISEEDSAEMGCRPAPAGTVIFPKIGAAIATNKKRMLSKNSCYDNNVMGLVPSNEVDQKFLYYAFSRVDLQSFSNDSGAVPSIRKSALEQFRIPAPPIETQREIVAKLDAFEALIQSLREEIELRHRRYEHYRDALLAFEKKGA